MAAVKKSPNSVFLALTCQRGSVALDVNSLSFLKLSDFWECFCSVSLDHSLGPRRSLMEPRALSQSCHLCLCRNPDHTSSCARLSRLRRPPQLQTCVPLPARRALLARLFLSQKSARPCSSSRPGRLALSSVRRLRRARPPSRLSSSPGCFALPAPLLSLVFLKPFLCIAPSGCL